ncbi:MAG: ribonuclease D [Aestuariivita sp.]|nr:ribonuclease D [Aestuariivita sp.]
MTNFLYQNDLPDKFKFSSIVAVDCETMGLNHHRDRLCVVQISTGDGNAHVVQIEQDQKSATNLTSMLIDKNILKLFHFGRFDIASLLLKFNVLTKPVYCTKIASRLARTNTDKHGLKDLCRTLLSIDISKLQQSSDWGTKVLSEDQVNYAATDVIYLHKIKAHLDAQLSREGRDALAQGCFDFLPHRARLDIAGWQDVDLFAHK